MTALIIVTYNNVECLRRCLASAREHCAGSVVPIIVDNGGAASGDAAVCDAVSEAWGESPHVLEPDMIGDVRIKAAAVVVTPRGNQGYARGNNLGASAARAIEGVDYVMFANDDVSFVADIVPGLRQVLFDDDKCGVASPVLLRPDMRSIDRNCARLSESVADMVSDNFLKYWWLWRGLSHSPSQSARYILPDTLDDACPARVKVDLTSGACMMMRLRDFERVGGFDPHTFLYYEENILQAKLSRLGMHAIVDTRLKAVHQGAATTSGMPDSYAIMRESCRSQRWYVKNYAQTGTLMSALHKISVFFLLCSYRAQKIIAPGYMHH